MQDGREGRSGCRDFRREYRCVRCGAYFERKRDEEEGFDIEAHSRNANYFGSGGI